MRLGVSAVQHDMKREETVEEVEKNTEWQRRTPKPEAPGSSPGRRTKNAVISRDCGVFSFCLSSKFHSCYRVKRLHGTTS